MIGRAGDRPCRRKEQLMGRNGTVNQEPAVLRASSDGSSRDTQGRREAGPQPQAAGLLWSRVHVGAVIVAGCAVLSAAIVEMMGQPMIDAEARLDLFDLPARPSQERFRLPFRIPTALEWPSLCTPRPEARSQRSTCAGSSRWLVSSPRRRPGGSRPERRPHCRRFKRTGRVCAIPRRRRIRAASLTLFSPTNKSVPGDPGWVYKR